MIIITIIVYNAAVIIPLVSEMNHYVSNGTLNPSLPVCQ